MVVVIGIGMVGVIGVNHEFVVNVKVVLKVAELFIESPSLHAVLNSVQLFVFALDFGDNGALICLELVAPFMVVVVLLYFCEGGRVVKGTGLFSQQVVGSPTGLE